MANVEQFPMTEAKNSILHGGHCISPGFCLATTPPHKKSKKSNPGPVSIKDKVTVCTSLPVFLQECNMSFTPEEDGY